MDFRIPRLYAIIDPPRRGTFRPWLWRILFSLPVPGFSNTAAKLIPRATCSMFAVKLRYGCGRQGDFIVNDRADVARLTDADGVHVGQEDLPVEDVRRILLPAQRVGVSTHSQAQFEEAAATSTDYIAFGPIFPTGSKYRPDPVVGLDRLREMRALTLKPLVAIGGITLDNAASVIEAGADSVAVIHDLLAVEDIGTRARKFLEALR